MAKEKKHPKISPAVSGDTFVPDLLVSKPSGLGDALAGMDEPVIEPSVDNENPLDLGVKIDTELSTGKVKRKYTKRNKGQDISVNDLDIIDGEDIQMFMDLVIPMAIAGIHNMTNKEKMSPDVIMLTSKQEEKMNRLCQKVADKMKVSMNPVLALAIGVSVAYGGNYMKNKP